MSSVCLEFTVKVKQSLFPSHMDLKGGNDICFCNSQPDTSLYWIIGYRTSEACLFIPQLIVILHLPTDGRVDVVGRSKHKANKINLQSENKE